MAPPSTSTSIGDSASRNGGASTVPPPSTTAAEQGNSSPQRPACTRSDGGADDVRLQSLTADAEARRMLTPDIQEWLDALTARQAREVGHMQAAVEAIKAELEAVQAERENDRRSIAALRHRVDVLETERRVGYLAMVEAAEFRVSLRAASASAVRLTRPA